MCFLPAFSLFFLRVLRVLRGSKSKISIAAWCGQDALAADLTVMKKSPEGKWFDLPG